MFLRAVVVNFPLSPGFSPRPSLSVMRLRLSAFTLEVLSPGFSPRPSLSGRGHPPAGHLAGAPVAGVFAPAFVERFTR